MTLPALSTMRPVPEVLKIRLADRSKGGRRKIAGASSVGASRVERHLELLRQAEPGERNQALNRAAYQIGKISPADKQSDGDVCALLLAVCEEIGLLDDDGEEACVMTIRSGLTSGVKAQKQTLASVLATLNTSADHTNKPASEVASRSLRLIPEAECGSGERAPYVIKSFIAREDFICIFGPPGSGKSVLAPFLCSAIARGEPFFGHKVRQGPVIYIAAEDASGLGNRIRALVNLHGSSNQLYLVDGLTDLGAESGAQLKELATILRDVKPVLIVIDTLAMGFPGLDENSSEAMSKVVSVGRALTKMGCAVLLIHHDTKSGSGTPRGHSILNGALDVAVQLKPADKAGIVRGQLTKNRNGSPDALSISFRIEGQEIGTDEDGDAITAPILIEEKGMTTPRAKLSRSEQAALTELETLMPVQWEPSDPIPQVALSDWRKACVTGFSVSGVEKRESRAKAFSRALAGLCEKARIVIEDETVSFPKSKGGHDASRH